MAIWLNGQIVSEVVMGVFHRGIHEMHSMAPNESN